MAEQSVSVSRRFSKVFQVDMDRAEESPDNFTVVLRWPDGSFTERQACVRRLLQLFLIEATHQLLEEDGTEEMDEG